MSERSRMSHMESQVSPEENPPPPPPGDGGGGGASGEKSRQPEDQYQLMAAAAAGGVPPESPDNPEKNNDPNRKYGFITSSDGRIQKYSYLNESERLRKSEFLRKNPDYDVPPGDPCNAPKDAKFGFVVTVRPGSEPVRETYWYRTEEERVMVSKIIQGE